METKIFTIRTRSGLHCGIGQGLSDIDLPTAKESVSGYPFIPGTSLKGVLRDRFDDDSELFKAAFGQAATDKIDFAAALSFTDARLLCLPVRAYFGTFAYLTSPSALGLLKETLKQSGIKGLPGLPDYPLPTQTDSYRASLPPETKLLGTGELANKILLEDLDLLVDGESASSADKWASLIADLVFGNDGDGKRLFGERFVIADDNVLAFLCETALPVATHNKIGDNGVVVDMALWFEEFVPPETIFYGSIHGEDSRNPKAADFSARQLLDFICEQPIYCQVGGNATTGRGLVSMGFPDVDTL